MAPFDSAEAPRWDTYQLNEEEVPEDGEWLDLIREISLEKITDFKTKRKQDEVYNKIDRRKERCTRLWTELIQLVGNPYTQMTRVEESKDPEQGSLRGSYAKLTTQTMTELDWRQFNKLMQEKLERRERALLATESQYETDETSTAIENHPRVQRYKGRENDLNKKNRWNILHGLDPHEGYLKYAYDISTS